MKRMIQATGKHAFSRGLILLVVLSIPFAAEAGYIQDQVDAATAGDTIVIPGGGYQENVVVNGKDNLTIRAAAGAEVIVTPLSVAEPVFYLHANGVRIEDLTIQGPPDESMQKAGVMIGYHGAGTTKDIHGCSVHNCEISLCSGGIWQNYGWGGVFTTNTLINNMGDGIQISAANSCTIGWNEISGCSDGVYIYVSQYSDITGNTISDCRGYGMRMYGEYLTVAQNTMVNNLYNFNISGEMATHTVTENTVNGLPVYYFVSQSSFTVPAGTGCLYLINCTDIEVKDLPLSHNSPCIGVRDSQNITIHDCAFSDCNYGLSAFGGSGLTVTGCSVTDAEWGLWLSSVDDFSLTGNTCSNSKFPIEAYCNNGAISNNVMADCRTFKAGSSNTTISGNDLQDCNEMEVTGSGVQLNNNNLRNCVLTLKGSGIQLSGNTMDGDGASMRLEPASDNFSSLTIDDTNTINDKPVYYWKGQSGRAVPANASLVGLIDCGSITASGLELSGNSHGMLLINTSDTLVQNVSVSSCQSGIRMDNSSSNTIENCELIDNGIGLRISADYGQNGGGNIIAHNDFVSNWSGLSIGSPYNELYLNNFVNTYYSPGAADYGTSNTWRTPEPVSYRFGGADPLRTSYLGNFYDDYSGVDSDNDGIGDTPYVLYEDSWTYNADDYPLMAAVDQYTTGTVTSGYAIYLVSPWADVVVDPLLAVYPLGTTVTLTATPHDGYAFSEWDGNPPADQATSNPLTLVMNCNRYLTAECEITTITVRVATDYLLGITNLNSTQQQDADKNGDGFIDVADVICIETDSN